MMSLEHWADLAMAIALLATAAELAHFIRRHRLQAELFGGEQWPPLYYQFAGLYVVLAALHVSMALWPAAVLVLKVAAALLNALLAVSFHVAARAVDHLWREPGWRREVKAMVIAARQAHREVTLLARELRAETDRARTP